MLKILKIYTSKTHLYGHSHIHTLTAPPPNPLPFATLAIKQAACQSVNVFSEGPPPHSVQSSSPRVKVTVYLTRDVTSADEQFGKANTVKLCFSEYTASEPESKKKKKGKGQSKTLQTCFFIF